jgi:hypothetical protein
LTSTVLLGGEIKLVPERRARSAEFALRAAVMLSAVQELRAWVAACDANTADYCPALEKLAH